MAFPFGSTTSAQLLTKNRRKNQKPTRNRCFPAASRAGKLLFDPLEPSVLLSADVLAVDLAQGAWAHQDHSLVVQMVSETQQTGQTAQTVQRVEVVDQAHSN